MKIKELYEQNVSVRFKGPFTEKQLKIVSTNAVVEVDRVYIESQNNTLTTDDLPSFTDLEELGLNKIKILNFNKFKNISVEDITTFNECQIESFDGFSSVKLHREVVFIDCYIKDSLPKLEIIDPTAVHIINCGIDESVFDKLPAEIREAEFSETGNIGLDLSYNNITTLKGLSNTVKSVEGDINLTKNPIKSGCLELLKIKKLNHIEYNSSDTLYKAISVLNRYLSNKTSDVCSNSEILKCKAELEREGLGSYI